jgi:ubiquinone/menaquinone biosynthesis C-methylase UbiE
MGAQDREPPEAEGRKPLRVASLEGHRIWSQTYDDSPNPMLALEARILAKRLVDLTGKRFLDVGCGSGRWLVEAQARGAAIVGLDACPEMLAVARAKLGTGVPFIQADIRRLPVRCCCADVVLCAFSLAYAPPLEEVIEELRRAARPGGSVIITDVHPSGLRSGWTRSFRNGSEVYEIEHQPYTIEELAAAGRSAGLDLQELLEPRFDEPEREIFRRAGREDFFGQASAIPAVVVARWRRPDGV